MKQDELRIDLENLALRFSEGWHEGIKIDASDIMLLNKAAQALAQPEPCDMGDICIGCSPRNADGSCPSSQRKFVGLTDDEIEVLFQTAAGADEEVHIRFARAIESKLKEVNT